MGRVNHRSSFTQNTSHTSAIRNRKKYPILSDRKAQVVPLNARFLQQYYGNQVWYDSRSRTFRKVSNENLSPRELEQHYDNQIWYDQRRGVFRKVSHSNLYQPSRSYYSRSVGYEQTSSRTASYTSTYYQSSNRVTSYSSRTSTQRTISSSYNSATSSRSRRGISRSTLHPANKSDAQWLEKNGHKRLVDFTRSLGLDIWSWKRAKPILHGIRAEEEARWEEDQMWLMERIDREGDIKMTMN
ncbi:hypothetical protein HYFRA_00001459 [Hymenoscyphus fraxineus]|uniref:Uncharacterized protein n=1 Tax=Hymenoscyphus fraxineus TaxID=746836 RepID=A0A9N9PY46_9HELO|nr:hypothetical protein HYFRA_00001459 [Hymenoscyphus fraxineus]